MTTNAFQYLFDNAQSISINRKGVVAQTITRDQTIRAVSRGGQVWRFEVKMPDGFSWEELRPVIEAIEYADRFTVGTVQINHAGYNNWLTPYQGTETNTMTGYVSGLGGNTITILGGNTGHTAFKAGDFVQLGTTGRVYSVLNTVEYEDNAVVTLHRPIAEASGSYNLIVGTNVTWKVLCTSIPSWTIYQRNQVSWSGAFSFTESLV